MLKPVSTNTIVFDEENEQFEFFEDLFHTMLKVQSEMTEAMKINHFRAHLRRKAFQTLRKISASNKETLDDVLMCFNKNESNYNHKLQLNTNGTNSRSIPIQNHCLKS